MNTESQGLSPLRILLAEDERSVAFSIAFALKIDGHKFQVVADGWQALASIARDEAWRGGFNSALARRFAQHA